MEIIYILCPIICLLLVVLSLFKSDHDIKRINRNLNKKKVNIYNKNRLMELEEYTEIDERKLRMTNSNPTTIENITPIIVTFYTNSYCIKSEKNMRMKGGKRNVFKEENSIRFEPRIRRKIGWETSRRPNIK